MGPFRVLFLVLVAGRLLWLHRKRSCNKNLKKVEAFAASPPIPPAAAALDHHAAAREKPVVVRLKRKAFRLETDNSERPMKRVMLDLSRLERKASQARLDAFRLEINDNERPMKKVSNHHEPIVVRLKRKAPQPRLDAFRLEIDDNERPVKKAMLDLSSHHEPTVVRLKRKAPQARLDAFRLEIDDNERPVKKAMLDLSSHHEPPASSRESGRRDQMDPAAAATRRTSSIASGTPTATNGSSAGSSCSSSASNSAGTTRPTIAVPWAGDGCYYPGCRNDANCDCEMCLASIRAMRDRVLTPEAASAHSLFAGEASVASGTPTATHGSSAGSSCSSSASNSAHRCFAGEAASAHRFFAGAAARDRRPTPTRSTAKSRQAAAGARGRTGASSNDWALYAATVVGFLVLLWVDRGLVPEAVARGFGPKLSPLAFALSGVDARLAPGGLDQKLRVLERRVAQFVGAEKVANCSAQDSEWRFHTGDQHVFHWRCVVYKSAAEELSVWGSPLRTYGLIPATLSARTFSLLAGKITEWSDGRRWPTVRETNGSSWGYRRYAAAMVRLEPETWVMEYQRSALFEGTRLIPTVAEVLVSRWSRMARRARSRMATQRLSGGVQGNPT